MRISTNSCLCPFLVCLCFIQRCYGAGGHLPAKVPSKNQTRLANGETEVHHRPKRGWIWNQFFVLEEHMGPDAQYVGKVRVFTSRHRTQISLTTAAPSCAWLFPPLSLFTGAAGCSRNFLFCCSAVSALHSPISSFDVEIKASRSVGPRSSFDFYLYKLVSFPACEH